ncbi:SpvB/TcaC N-terminal domain-containing protein, partial [Streptomyces sp. NPDC060002]|uniref:SpvB/TcaC N-terminal domain-containing protein n=1 Tax=Streptomyces sp. NPDC060002 TaxID=3347033 RepID=UPI0036C222EB
MDSGYLPGDLNVSPSGEATYDIPLAVPAGPAGAQPSLGLHYSSSAGNGTMGVGWSVAGLSAISHCGKSIATEGRTTGISFRTADSAGGDAARFCLDGQKLVGVSGAYGQSGAEYRTETESFTKFVSRDSDSTTGPGWFEVWLKNGRRLEYRPQRMDRLTADSDGISLDQANVALTYPLAKDTDPSGNVIEYSYTLDTPKTCPVNDLRAFRDQQPCPLVRMCGRLRATGT